MLKRHIYPFSCILAVGLLLSGCSKPDRTEVPKEKTSAQHSITITEDNFAETIQNQSGVALVDFWATWCRPCLYIAPFLEEIAEEYKGRITVGKVDVDKNNALATRYKIEALPTVVLFKNGKAIDMQIGALKKEEYVAWIEKHL